MTTILQDATTNSIIEPHVHYIYQDDDEEAIKSLYAPEESRIVATINLDEQGNIKDIPYKHPSLKSCDLIDSHTLHVLGTFPTDSKQTTASDETEDISSLLHEFHNRNEHVHDLMAEVKQDLQQQQQHQAMPVASKTTTTRPKLTIQITNTAPQPMQLIDSIKDTATVPRKSPYNSPTTNNMATTSKMWNFYHTPASNTTTTTTTASLANAVPQSPLPFSPYKDVAPITPQLHRGTPKHNRATAWNLVQEDATAPLPPASKTEIEETIAEALHRVRQQLSQFEVEVQTPAKRKLLYET